MKIFQNLTPSISIRRPLAITIGNFDGVHLGHQVILSRLRESIGAQNGQILVISFQNHPVEILREGIFVPKLCSLQHKQKLLQEQSIDYLVLLPFTKEFSQQTPEEFLSKLQELCPFDYLILGHDAVLGRNRQGGTSQVQSLAKLLNFKVEYLEVQSVDGISISSSKIRSLIMSGDFFLAEKLLGRRYSIYGPFQIQQNGILTIEANGLCLPPPGKYEVKVVFSDFDLNGFANLSQTTVRLELQDYMHEEVVRNRHLEVIF